MLAFFKMMFGVIINAGLNNVFPKDNAWVNCNLRLEFVC